MDWKAYQTKYWKYELSANQTRLLNQMCGYIFDQFPNRIPKELKEGWLKNLTSVHEIFEKLIKMNETKISESIDIDQNEYFEKNKDNLLSSIFNNQLSVFLAMFNIGIRDKFKIDFEQLLFAQELVIQLAHIESFMVDSLKTISILRPETLKCNKKINWDKVIELGSWEKILENLIEDYTYEFGMKSINEQIEFLQEKYNMNLGLTTNEIAIFKEAENIRHIIVHNGGRVSKEFIDKTNNKNYQIGDYIPISANFVINAVNAFLFLASELYHAISKKFFHKSDLELGFKRLPG